MKANQILPGQLRLIVSVTILHVLVWLAYYGQTPTGLIPTAEEAHYLDAVQRLAVGNPAEPPSPYVFVLAVCEIFASTENDLIQVARILNGLLMVIGAALCASAAGQIWKKNRAVWISGLLVGLNPVLVFWVGHVGPTLLAFSALAFAVWRSRRCLRHPTPRDALWTGAGLSLAAVFEPGLLALALAWPISLFFFTNKRRARLIGSATLPPALAAIAWLVLPVQPNLGFSIDPGQFLERGYTVLNSFEFFPGKSYSLYNQSETLLRINPIHWGLVLILTAGGVYARLKNGHSRQFIYLLLGGFGLFALSYMLFGLTSRERIIALPLLAIPAGGAGYLPQIWRHGRQRTRQAMVVGTLALAALTYSNLYQIRNESRFRADYLRLAETHLALGLDEGARRWADRALEVDPSLTKFHYIRARARFNEWAINGEPRPLPIEDARTYLDTILDSGVQTPAMATLEAVYRWKLRQNDAALELWRAHRDTEPLALLCLAWVGQANPSPDVYRSFSGHPDADFLEEALRVNRNALDYSEMEQRIDNLVAYAY